MARTKQTPRKSGVMNNAKMLRFKCPCGAAYAHKQSLRRHTNRRHASGLQPMEAMSLSPGQGWDSVTAAVVMAATSASQATPLLNPLLLADAADDLMSEPMGNLFFGSALAPPSPAPSTAPGSAPAAASSSLDRAGAAPAPAPSSTAPGSAPAAASSSLDRAGACPSSAPGAAPAPAQPPPAPSSAHAAASSSLDQAGAAPAPAPPPPAPSTAPDVAPGAAPGVAPAAAPSTAPGAVPAPAPSSPAPSSASNAAPAQPVRLAPRKDMSAAYLYHRARGWLRRPEIHTADLHRLIAEFPEAGAATLAEVIVNRFDLGSESVRPLRRRLSGMLYERQMARQDVLRLLPVGDLDGNTAIAAVLRLATWAKAEEPVNLPPFE